MVEIHRNASPFEVLRTTIQNDPDYAWGWLCNLAVPIMDATGVSHELANQAAALIMAQMFDTDITAHPNFEYTKTGRQAYFEARIAAERECNKEASAKAERDRLLRNSKARIQALTAEVERLRKLLQRNIDNEPCRLDHHGYCQTHYLEEDCSVAAARAALQSQEKVG